MKTTLIIIGLFFSILSYGQINMSETEKGILKEIISQSNVSLKESPLKELQKTTPERFHGFISQLIATKDKPKKILEIKYLQRPTHEELIFWYVVREFHYNNSEPDSVKKTENEIIEWIIADTIDERWLLDNYYYRISGRLKFLFNKADLSNYDFKINELGFKNETEKAIFFFFMINSCGQGLSVMSFTGKGNPNSLIKRLPKINGKEYYYYISFEYPDFDWIGYKKTESYNTRHLGNYYNVLLNHLSLLLENEQKEEAKALFSNSILSKPELYKFSSSQDTLIKLYEDWK